MQVSFNDPQFVFNGLNTDGPLLQLWFTDGSTTELFWDGTESEPIFRGTSAWSDNDALRSSMLDYANRKITTHSAQTEELLFNWDDIADAVQDETPENEQPALESGQPDPQREKDQDKMIRELKKSRKVAENAMLSLAKILDFGISSDDTPSAEWCSACFSYSVHSPLKLPRSWSPGFVCSSCGLTTVPCSVPTCNNFAIRNNRPIALGRLCAEHTHSITNFDGQFDSIDDLTDWKKLLHHNKMNVPRAINNVTTVGSVSSVAFPLVAGAAPAIGGAIGSFSGLSGAAATNHGLALLGGGAKAAGGLGIAGGKLVISTIGTTVAGASGQRFFSSYFAQDKSFKITKMRDGSGPIVLYASGFTTENKDNWDSWEPLISSQYPDNPVFRVEWAAKELRALATFGGQQAAKNALTTGLISIAKQATRKAPRLIGRVSGVSTLLSLIANPWHTAHQKAWSAGTALAIILARTNFRDGFVLVGHSLGSVVMTKACEELTKLDKDFDLREVHLLAAALDGSRDTQAIASKVINRVFTYHSSNDKVLSCLFRAANLTKEVAGLNGFSTAHDKLMNVDCSSLVDKHGDYFSRVHLKGGHFRPTQGLWS